jgi:hypothetical protein
MHRKSLSILAICLVGIAVALMLLNQKNDSDSASNSITEPSGTRISQREGNSTTNSRSNRERASQRNTETSLMEQPIVIETNPMTAMWLEQARKGFVATQQHLVSDLGLDARQSEQLDAIFARRANELAELLASNVEMDAVDGQEHMKKIAALIRNKGLRDDLARVLSAEQLAAFDAAEATRVRETVEARAYHDLAQINEVAQLTDDQKPQVLGILAQQAAAKVEEEADSRAFMSLMFGGLAADMDSSHIRSLTNMVNADPTQASNLEYGSAEYMQWVEGKKKERIHKELSALQNVLTENQLERYRGHLEAEQVY